MTNMSPAEFRTAHDSLGVSTSFLAERLGRSCNRIWEFESPKRTLPVPESVAEGMADMVNAFDDAADELVLRVQSSGIIPRYADLDEFYAEHPNLSGWGAVSQGLLVAEVQRRTQLPIDFR